MPQSSEQPLNGQQMSQIQKQFAEQVVALRKDVDIRKWCADQACGLAGTAMEHNRTAVDPVKMAREIHAFLTEAVETLPK